MKEHSLLKDTKDNMATDSTIQGGAIMNAIKQVGGLFANINKTGGENKDSIVPSDEYESKFSEEQVLTLTSQWQKDYAGYYLDIEKIQDKDVAYWLGKQKLDMVDQLEGKDTVVNKLFEAVETFLPIATRSNPEPLVTADNSEEGQNLARDLKNSLVFQADKQKLRRKLARMTRQWLLYLIGGIEVDYDLEIDDLKTTVINPKRFIFDKEGSVDESGLFQGDYLGVRYKVSASRLAELFPKNAEYIRNITPGRKGTKIEYIKWWYKGTDVFFTMPNKVLGKFKNPHWNYDQPETIDLPAVEAINHLDKPTAPYVFLSIFNLGLQPHDETGLILQNIPQQDQINKRERQIDKNVDSQNNGIVVDGRVMDKEQAGLAASALRRGSAIIVQGDPNATIAFKPAPQLAGDIWNALQNSKQELQNIFGTSGSNPQGIKSEETARGKIMVNQMDASRIGGGVTEFIEQVADTIFNLWTQLILVHYDNIHFTNILGEDGQDTEGLSNSRFIKSVVVTVKEGSLIPKDPLTQRNEAIDLWTAVAIDPLNLYKKLDFPDPVGATQSLMLWKMFSEGQIPPEMYLPSFQSQAPAVNVAETVPGVGGPAINPGISPEAGVPTPPPASQDANAIQSQQLMGSVKI